MIKEYISVFEEQRRKIKNKLEEQLSFLTVYKHGDEEIMQMIENFIKKFNAPRVEIYRALSNLFTTLAQETELAVKEKEKKSTLGK
jgi:hypothetical protein